MALALRPLVGYLLPIQHVRLDGASHRVYDAASPAMGKGPAGILARIWLLLSGVIVNFE